MASYEEESNFVKLDWAMPFQRTNAFPLDRTMLFSSLDDAKAYAKGLDDKKNPQDSRKLGGSAYIGQIITVYENDIVKSYVIDANRELDEIILSDNGIVEINGVLNATPNGHSNIYSKNGSSIGKAFLNEVNGKTGIVKNTIGSKGFHVIGLKVEKVNNTDTLKIKLDGDLTELKTLVESENYKNNIGKYWFNLYLGSTNNYQFGYITDIDDDNWASINRNYFGENEWKSLKDVTEETFRSWFDSDLTLQNMNALFFINYPTFGNTIVNVGTSNAIGVGCSASGPGALATGYLTRAVGIGAHAEGAQTTAVGSAHAEGVGSAAMSNNSHAEGYYTQAKGYFSHSEGGMTKALANASHTEGWNTVANENAVYSFVGGQNNVTNGDTSFTFGYQLYNNAKHTMLFGGEAYVGNIERSFVFAPVYQGKNENGAYLVSKHGINPTSDAEIKKLSYAFIVNSNKHDGLDSIVVRSTVDGKAVFKTLKELISDADTNLSNTVVNTYLSASVFEALSNEIGLSAANKENPVVTKKDIASLAGAMHFIGAATLNENEDAKAGLIRTFPKAIKGDVAIIISTSKEYVYIGDKAGQTSSWVELGDESLYATKAELSSEISNRISAYSTLSTAIDNKISIDGIKTNTLSAFHINQDDFYKKVQNNEILSNELYFVSSDYINAYDEQVKNVAEPVDASDAVTKNYVDTKLLSSETDFDKKISDLRKELNDSFTKNLNTLSTNLKTDYDKQISALTERLKTAETKIEELSTTVGKANEILGGIV